MKIKVKDYYGSVKAKDVEVTHFINGKLDGNDYGRGELESLSATSSKTKEAFANLVNVLADKGLLSEDDIKEIVSGIY